MLRYSLGWTDEQGRQRGEFAGKGLRPTLCLFACEAAGGALTRAVPAAVALELIHNFSLIHDDIQDRDEVRYHRPTLWSVWGDPKALVAGNTLRVIADSSVHRLVEAGVDLDGALRVAGLLTEAYLQMIEGQYLDLAYEGRPHTTVDEYFKMIALKTGALIRSSLHIGATIGTNDPATVERFRECGSALGLVFQVRDDILGVWGDEEMTGKPVGADIRRKKNSFPIVYAMSKAAERDRRSLESVYSKEHLDDSDVSTVLEIMERTGVQEMAHRIASEGCDGALEQLDVVEMSAEARRDIEDVARFLLVRER